MWWYYTNNWLVFYHLVYNSEDLILVLGSWNSSVLKLIQKEETFKIPVSAWNVKHTTELKSLKFDLAAMFNSVQQM